jgi:hypothetical protein
MWTFKYLIRSIIFLPTLLFYQVYAEDTRKIWECNSGDYYIKSAEHNLWLVEDESKSYVKFYDSRITARYYLYGLERRWDWEDGNFSVRLKPDNIALYFDFNGVEEGKTTSAKSHFGCKQIQG